MPSRVVAKSIGEQRSEWQIWERFAGATLSCLTMSSGSGASAPNNTLDRQVIVHRRPSITTEVSVKHSIGYLGHFDRDFQNLRAGPRHYVREDRSLGQVDDRPHDVDGIFFGYLEWRGKTFVAVRAQYG